MGATAVVVVPMMGRPWAAQPLADSLAASGADARLMFVVQHHDHEVRGACAATGADVLAVEWPVGPGDYPRKINNAAAVSREPWIFTGASDVVFRTGWLEAALARAADGFRGVIGTNDLGNSLVRQGKHSTHSLVHRDYLAEAVIDEPGHLYCERYDHNYCDMELIDYATFKGKFRHARDSVVEHLHPNWRKATMDATYQRGRDGFQDDQLLWLERRQMWRPPDARAAARNRVTRARLDRRV